MRRILLVLSLMALMAAMLVATAMPAFAVADPQASCSGEAQSSAETGDVGQSSRYAATQLPAGTLGDIHSGSNQNENCFGGTSYPGTGAPGKPFFAQG
jgi:hypothetical protein